MESDEEIRRVPEVGLELAGPSTSGSREATAAAGTSSAASQAASAARRRGRSPADKEHRRLRRWVCLFTPLCQSIAEDMLIFIDCRQDPMICFWCRCSN